MAELGNKTMNYLFIHILSLQYQDNKIACILELRAQRIEETTSYKGNICEGQTRSRSKLGQEQQEESSIKFL